MGCSTSVSISKIAPKFRNQLLLWFAKNQRSLPWRNQIDPYRILLSEIMLQQTRVAVVEQRYRQFLERFPDINKLARARENTVLAAWSGLGYYRRARSLHAAAKEIVRRGTFPATARELIQLPGVGRYTANAVASIAFREAVPVVDGNVKRVLTRFCGHALNDDQCWQVAGGLLDRHHPGDFNQAIMELGAVVCLPRRPLCAQCPVESFCAAKAAAPRGGAIPRKKSILGYALAVRGHSILLRQRPHSASLMPGMWELPSLPATAGKRPVPMLKLRHSITSTDYSVFVYAVDPVLSRGVGKGRGKTRWISLRSAGRLPLTGLTRKIVDHVRNNYS